MILEIATIANNVTNIATTYTVDQINGAIQERILFGFFKIVAGFLIALGISKTGIKELKGVIVAVLGIFGVLGAIDFFRAIMGALTQTMP